MLHSRAAHWLLAGLTLGLLSLVAWAGGAWPQELWGLGFGGVLGQGTRAGLLVGAIALLACAAAGWLERPGRILGRWLERRPWLGYGTLLVALLLALLALHSHQAWYGAGNAVNDLERQYTTNLFSCLYLQTLARSIGSLAFVEPLQHPRDPIVALVSLASALPWFLVLVGLAQRSDPDRRAPHLALLLAAPALALFAGHREIYFVPVLMLALYAWVASTEIERARLPWLSGLVAGLAVSAHMLNAALLPSLLPLALGRERLGARSVSRAAVLGLGFLLGFGGPLAYRWHFGWHGVIPDDPFVVWGSFAHLQPGENGLLWAWESHPHKGFWSAEHLRDLGNALLFQAPFLPLLPLLWGSHTRRDKLQLRFLLVLWLGSLAVFIVDRPFGGHYLQWSHNAGFGLCSVLLLVGLLRRRRDTGGRAEGALLALTAHQALSLLLVAAQGLGPQR
jgi:hypothetical protein